MSLSPPPAKKAQLSSEKQISDLADSNLCEIFNLLPLFDRLIASEVCRRWLGLSRKPWLDVEHLDLNPIPGPRITSIIKLCPNLQSVFALGKSFDRNELAYLSKSCQLSTVKLYNCVLAVKSDRGIDSFAQIFGENIQQASWDELVLHNARVEERSLTALPCEPAVTFACLFLPASLTRLQLSGLLISSKDYCVETMFLNALDRLQHLECLILHSTPDFSYNSAEFVDRAFYFCHHLFEKISALKNLKELCIGPALQYSRQGKIGPLVASLPKLEVLFLNETGYDMAAHDLKDLITKNSVLRILVLSGGERSFWNYSTIDLPARKRFPNGFGSDPLPLLHIFVGKPASEKFRFSKSASDAALIYPIIEPTPQFLEREDIAPIFEGVWVAEKIRETARNGGRLWNYHIDDMAVSVQNIEI